MGAAKFKPTIREMSIKAITADHDLQSRVETSQEYVKEYAEALLLGAIFPAVVVFFDGKKYWLADGFHRLAAHKKAGRSSISADVREGTKRDAVFYSAGANVKMGIRPTREDVKKAIFMLFSDNEYWDWSDKQVGRHCGVNSRTVGQYRNEYSEKYGKPIPEFVLTQSDIKGCIRHPYRLKRTDRLPRLRTNKSTGDIVARLYGKDIYFGKDIDNASSLLESIVSKRDNAGKDSFKSIMNSRNLQSWLLFKRISSRPVSPNEFPLKGIVIGSAYISICEIMDYKSLCSAVLRAILAKGKMEGITRAIVCLSSFNSVKGGIGVILPLCRDIGIEFMTPEQIVAEFGPKPDPAQPEG